MLYTRDCRWVSALLLAGLSAQESSTPVWLAKPPAEWSAEEAYQILVRSPWSVKVPTMLLRLQSEAERRDGGQMGRPHGVGYDYIDGAENKKKPDGAFTRLPPRSKDGLGAAGAVVQLRWETAMPVRLASLKTKTLEPPTLDTDGFILAVYGIPGKFFNGPPEALGTPLRKDAVLRREGRKDVRPIRVEVFQRDHDLIVAYIFSRTEEFSPKDKIMQFRAQIGRFVLEHNFDLEAMRFQGRLEM